MTIRRTVSVLLATCFLLVSCGLSQRDDQPDRPDETMTFQTNFYQAVNQEWLNGNWISGGSPFYNEFTRLQIDIDEQLRTDFEQMASGVVNPTSDDMAAFIKLYKQGFDFTTRRKDGISSVQYILDDMTAVDSFSALARISPDWVINGYQLPFEVEVIVNPKDTSQAMLMLSEPQTILPNKSYYEDQEQKEKLLDSFRSSVGHLLVGYGYSKEEAHQLLEKAIAFDGQLVPYLRVAEELHSGPTNEQQLTSFSEVKNYSSIIEFDKLFIELVGDLPEIVYVANPDYFEALETIVQEEHFLDYKAWALVHQMITLAPYLTGEMMQIVDRFQADVQGRPTTLPNEYVTYLEVMGVFKESLSVYYGQIYADDATIEEVQEMSRAIVTTYKESILDQDWLSPQTKEAAIQKLDNLSYYIGSPETVKERTRAIQIDDSKSYVDNILTIQKKDRKASFEYFGEPIDRQSWNAHISSSDVTATYSPYQNAIYIPAAILQAPYFDQDQSPEENYAGIGKIIAHEISHALDSTGANFDETGSLKDWWTEKDRQNFSQKTATMVTLFDGLEIYGGQVNGQLTLSENIADAGGVTIALQTLKKEVDSPNLKTFFEHYAMSRREVVTPEYGNYQLKTAVHAPEEFRVNIQLQQLDDFYQTYDIKKGDPMYRAPKDRVRIW